MPLEDWMAPGPVDSHHPRDRARVDRHSSLVPDQLRGRVNSVYFLFDLGGAALGTLLGGGLAAVLGITAPVFLGSGAVALLILAAWPRFTPDALASPTIGLDRT
jgi:MFS family permease